MSGEENITKGLGQLMRTAAEVFEGRELQQQEQAIFDFRGGAGENGAPQSGATLEDWTRLDDVIMGGISDSSFKLEGGEGSEAFNGCALRRWFSRSQTGSCPVYWMFSSKDGSDVRPHFFSL